MRLVFNMPLRRTLQHCMMFHYSQQGMMEKAMM